MAHNFTFTIDVTLERTEGKFATRDEMVEAITEVLDSANPDSIDGIGSDGTSTYEVTDWAVTETTP